MGVTCTLMCQGADASILVLAPILLLLGQDRLLCSGLSVRRRYFPPAAACVAFLVLKVREWRLTCHAVWPYSAALQVLLAGLPYPSNEHAACALRRL